MIFSELYSAYYKTVAGILAAAVKHPLQKGELRALIEQKAFGESVLTIGPAIEGRRWQLIRADGSTPIRHVPTMPLTTLEKQWLNAIAADPRMRLFSDEKTEFPEVGPLFRPEDIAVFDRYADGDPYTDEAYIRRFRLILDAIGNRYPLRIDVAGQKGGTSRMTLMPEYLEYSEKDDKFRLIGAGHRQSRTVNLARIVRCEPSPVPVGAAPAERCSPKLRTVELEVADRRNAPERVLMHFAHFEKRTERVADDRYRVTVSYDGDDETELVIRLLSFGPMVKVTAPPRFVGLMRERLQSQKSCGH